jgi:hypothetical protein
MSRRYMTLGETLKYTQLSVGALKSLIEIGGLRFINSGAGPVFDLHDVQKAMHRIKGDGLGPVANYFVEAWAAEIKARNAAKREAAKGKPPTEPPVITVPECLLSAELKAAEPEETAEKSSDTSDLFG